MTSFFLISLSMIAFFIKGNDRMPALIYCLVAHLFNYAAMLTSNDGQIFIMGAVGEVVLVALLVCLSGCMRSKITAYLIPLSIVSIAMHYWGWRLHLAGIGMETFNSAVVFYWCVIMALFISRVGRDGNIAGNSRFLRSDSNRRKTVGVVFK